MAYSRKKKARNKGCAVLYFVTLLFIFVVGAL